jgi:hypothetical protein
MKHYKILTGYADGKKLEQEVNDNAELGYVIAQVLQQSDNGTYICIIMVKEG